RPLVFIQSLFTTIKCILIIKKKGFDFFIKVFKIKKINFGDLIYDSYIKKNQKFLNPSLDFQLYNTIFTACCRIFYIYDLIISKNINFIVVNTTAYSLNDGVAARIGVFKKKKVLELTAPTTIISHNLTTAKYGFQNIKKNYSIKKINDLKLSENKLNKFIKNRFENKIKGFYTTTNQLSLVNPIKSKIYSRDDLINLYFKNQKFKKIIVITSHAFSDSPHESGYNLLFNDYYDQLKQTILYIQKIKLDDILWLVRPNPTSIYNGEYKLVKKLVEEVNYKFLKITPEKISSKNIIKICDHVITSRGTMALEFACFGKGSLITGSAPYSGMGIVKEFKDKSVYFKAISNINVLGNLSKKKIIIAKKALYFLETYNRRFFNWNDDLRKISSLGREGELLRKITDMKNNNDLKNKELVSTQLEFLKIIYKKKNIIFNSIFKKI
ncbi:hypothetical protein N8745_04380, partial [Candidatus Pelagibacter sp.]|nr:hypothetical protein [Candidatus Pelagibacter sp.]